MKNAFVVSLQFLIWVFVSLQNAPAQPRSHFTVGPITAKAGEKISGQIQVPAANDEGTMIPISVLHGARSGPVLALIAGNHGYEYAPIIALQRLLPQLDPQKMAGTVIMIHVANMPSFLRRTIYYSPVDGENLNRVYPGKTDGTVSERIAYQITKEVIARADYVLDLHCGDGNESLRHYSYWDVMNVMRHLKMLEGQAQLVEHPIFIDRNEVLRSKVTGIFYPLVERGHMVAEGTLLGYVTDFAGKRLSDLRAPFSGEILYILGTPPVSQGEPLAMIGQIGEAAH